MCLFCWQRHTCRLSSLIDFCNSSSDYSNISSPYDLHLTHPRDPSCIFLSRRSKDSHFYKQGKTAMTMISRLVSWRTMPVYCTEKRLSISPLSQYQGLFLSFGNIYCSSPFQKREIFLITLILVLYFQRPLDVFLVLSTCFSLLFFIFISDWIICHGNHPWYRYLDMTVKPIANISSRVMKNKL